MAVKLKQTFDCEVDWDAMEGDDQQRFCAQCQQTVYNLTGLTDDEINALFDEHCDEEGAICARTRRTPSGLTLTSPCASPGDSPGSQAASAPASGLGRGLAWVGAGLGVTATALGLGATQLDANPARRNAQLRQVPLVGNFLANVLAALPPPEDCSAKRAGDMSNGRNIRDFATSSKSHGI